MKEIVKVFLVRLKQKSWNSNENTQIFYKNPVYKNHEAQILEILRIFLRIILDRSTRTERLWFHCSNKIRTYFETIIQKLFKN